MILEKAKQIEKALVELNQLIEQYPANSSALYRMGVVKYGQEDYPAAQQFFERALEVNPGLYGAMEVLKLVHQVLGNSSAELDCLRKLRRKMPYSISHLRDEVLAIQEAESTVAAVEHLDAAAHDFPSPRIGLLRARLHLVDGNPDLAAEMLTAVETDHQDEEQFEESLQLELGIAQQRDDADRVLKLCDRGLKRWPDSTRLKEIKADYAARSDPNYACQLLKDTLVDGEPQPQTAWQYLSLSDRLPDRAAKDVILAAPVERQDALVELFSDVMSDGAFVHRNAQFLQWGLEQFPDVDLLRWRLALHYNISNNPKAAVDVAQQLYNRNPDNPEAARILGRCLIDLKPREAVKLLEKVCEQNRSADYLLDLARCYQFNGKNKQSRKLHYEILQQNPFMSCSWTNLYLLKAPKRELWPYLQPMLDRGCGLEDEYFLVAAVLIAISQRQQLPTSWFPTAKSRWQLLQTHPGFRDERQKLRQALIAWCSRRPDDADTLNGLSSGFFDRLSCRLIWPRFGWIPTT